MEFLDGLRQAFQRDADAIRGSIQVERQWCLDAFLTARPILAAALDDAAKALMAEPLDSLRHPILQAHYETAVNALWFCNDRIEGLREGMAALAADDTKET